MFKNKSILIIDDSETIHTYLGNVLKTKGAVDVDGAATGQAGLEKCAHHAYDLILLDLIMPDMDGIEVLQRIRATNDTSTVVVITGHGGIKSAIAASHFGADGYIEKQDITVTRRDHMDFMYALEQAIEHRAGLVAQKQLEQVRAEFYSIVAHDMRNPATLIAMASDMLTDGSVEPLTPRQNELVTLIGEATDRLLRLTKDYLDFAKIEAGYLRLNRTQIDLRQLIESSVRIVRLQAEVKQQTLTLDMPPTPVLAWVDAEKFRQVFDNLLSNAVKYTHEEGHIVLHLRTEEDQVFFQVSDDGIGISSEQLPLIFTKYHRVPGQETARIAGTGLGLIIVKEIVEAHGGRIWVESNGVPGQGTTFTFTMPLTPENPAIEQRVVVPQPPFETIEPMDEETAALYQTFVQEAHEHIHILQDALRFLETEPQDKASLSRGLRAAHTLRGNAAAMLFDDIRDRAAHMEDMFRQANQGKIVLTPRDVADLLNLLGQIALRVEEIA
jgi:signal transduction histidine kinase/HPt (histidine-containing phosphotransfer) domain-containing protein